jgi:hypothetical protein
MKTKTKRTLTPAQVKARLAAYKPSWVVTLLSEYNKQRFPSLTQGADNLPEGKRLAGVLNLMRHYNPDFPRAGEDAGKWAMKAQMQCEAALSIAFAKLGLCWEKPVSKRHKEIVRDFRMNCGLGIQNTLAELGLRLEKAVLKKQGDEKIREPATKFLRDFREKSESWKKGGRKRRDSFFSCGDVYGFMLTHWREFEACRTKREKWRLLHAQFPDLKDFRRYYKLFARLWPRP